MIIVTLVFGGIFMMLITSLAGFVLTQKRQSTAKESREMAVQLAEAGIDYYKWFLAHNPNDTDGPSGSFPYVDDYMDPEGGVMGSYSIEASGVSSCGEIQSFDITSTGWTAAAPQFQRTVSARYARPSVAEYAYIINSNVWAGSDRQIFGPYHSNGGIRMDGTNQSTVTSGQTTWLCNSSFGCGSTTSQPGVFGAGPNSALWSYPQPTIDFGGISVDLADMKTRAQASGLYFATVSGASPRYGYRLVLQSNGTVDVYQVTNSTQIWSKTLEDSGNNLDGWVNRYEVVTAQTFLGNYTIPANCGLIFVEDRVWIEGVVSGKVTIAAADPDSAYNPDVLIVNNITYTTNNGADGLALIGENNVLLSLVAPEDLTLNGIFIAQNGRFGRNHYTTTSDPPNCPGSCDVDVPSAYDSKVQVDDLVVHGTIVSNGREGSKWTSGGSFSSGFADRFNSYDRNQATNPPPLTPHVSDDYEFIEWHEEN
jgi:hypothetical protein